MLYLAVPYLDRITVMYVDSGYAFPHVREHVHATCEKLGATLQVIRPEHDLRQFHAQFGVPADVVPVDAVPEMGQFTRGPRLMPWTQCCATTLWGPMHRAVTSSGATLVLRGSKKNDPRVSVPDGHVMDGIEYRSPLWDWTDEQVFGFLEEKGVVLPAHYPEVNESLDCWLCTAHLHGAGADRMRYTRDHYPELWLEVKDRVRHMEGVLMSHLVGLTDAIEECK